MTREKKLKQRIRYIKKDNKLISKSEVVSKSGAKYMVYIDLETKTYLIRNQNSLRKYEGGENINNMNVLKRTVKAHLEHLNCSFDREKRSRSFGKCPKNYSEAIHRQKLREQKEQESNLAKEIIND